MQITLVEAMRERSLREADLVRKTGIQQTTFYRIKTGASRPHIATRLAIADALSMKPNEISYPADSRPPTALPFPCAMDAYVLQRLPNTDPVLAAQWQWARNLWERRPDLHRRWQGYVANLRSGGPARGRDFDFATLRDWLASETGFDPLALRDSEPEAAIR